MIFKFLYNYNNSNDCYVTVYLVRIQYLHRLVPNLILLTKYLKFFQTSIYSTCLAHFEIHIQVIMKDIFIIVR